MAREHDDVGELEHGFGEASAKASIGRVWVQEPSQGHGERMLKTTTCNTWFPRRPWRCFPEDVDDELRGTVRAVFSASAVRRREATPSPAADVDGGETIRSAMVRRFQSRQGLEPRRPTFSGPRAGDADDQRAEEQRSDDDAN